MQSDQAVQIIATSVVMWDVETGLNHFSFMLCSKFGRVEDRPKVSELAAGGWLCAHPEAKVDYCVLEIPSSPLEEYCIHYDTPPEDSIPLAFPELDQQLQPLPPCHDSLESMQVFKQHCQIAEEYHEVKKEIALLEERKKELIAKLDQAEKEKVDAAQLAREFEALTEENRTLKLAQSQCVEQLEKLRIQYQKRQGSS
ncbi:MAP3K7 C-terminal like [Rhinolophus ferrumequinum]|uniref:MAP3K7 C-terminal like n=1 Tax=Rhinolophus ferrumequinum TaxID=59479 RepID=A0A7J8AF81_RHIFE|nr:MAP3K7 C-terminal like [Rhinolophus ferrumequinum]